MTEIYAHISLSPFIYLSFDVVDRVPNATRTQKKTIPTATAQMHQQHI